MSELKENAFIKHPPPHKGLKWLTVQEIGPGRYFPNMATAAVYCVRNRRTIVNGFVISFRELQHMWGGSGHARPSCTTLHITRLDKLNISCYGTAGRRRGTIWKISHAEPALSFCYLQTEFPPALYPPANVRHPALLLIEGAPFSYFRLAHLKSCKTHSGLNPRTHIYI